MATSGDSICFLVMVTCFVCLLVKYLTSRSNSTKYGPDFRPPPSPPSLPIIGHLHLMGSVLPKSFQNLARLYGPLIQLRLGASTCIVVSNSQVASQVMKTHDLNFSNRPQFGSSDHSLYIGSSFVTAPYGTYWRFMRKLCMTQLLSNSQLNRLSHIREQEIRKLLQSLITSSREAKASDLSIELTRLTNNIVCRMAMSTSCLKSVNDAEELKRLLKEFLQVAAKISVGEILGPLGKLDLFGYGKKVAKVVGKFDQIVERIMKEHEAKGNVNQGASDMMDILLEVQKDPNAEVKISRNDIKAFFMDIFMAGTDTTSAALQWAMAEIIRHPQVMNKLRAEIDEVVGCTTLVNELIIPNLPYLQAVVKEVLRLHPTAPFALRQSVEDCKITGYDVKGGTRTLINVYAIMRDPQVWENPEDFMPERFMTDNENSIEMKSHDFTYLPFGSGRRICPGVSLTLILMHTTIGALIQCFDWKVKDGDVISVEESSGFTTGLAKPLLCCPLIRFDPFTHSK